MEKEIQQLIHKRVTAVKNRDMEKAVNCYSPDVISYDVVGKLKYIGVDAIKNRLKEWLSTLSEIVDFEIVDVKINSGSDVAFCSSLNHINATNSNGSKLDMFWRETTCYAKINGIWKITHAHSSVPFDAETGLASIGLKPDNDKK